MDEVDLEASRLYFERDKALSSVDSPNRPDNQFEPHPCPVCGETIFPHHGSFDVCDECGWEDDWVQETYPDSDAGANEMSLNDYRAAFKIGWRPDWLIQLWEEEAEEQENQRRGR